jgi:hypothetical protein
MPFDGANYGVSLRQQWLNNLRSGAFKQIRNDIRKDDGYCAMGVLCATINPLEPESDPVYTKASEVVGSQELIFQIIEWNDVEELSFSEIADRVEAVKVGENNAIRRDKL